MKGGKSENLFMSCVGELVLESREFDLLLGQLMPDGSRSPGLVDNFGDLVDAGAIIQLVARDSEERGLLEDAVRLYDLASKHERVVELLNTLLSQVKTTCASKHIWSCFRLLLPPLYPKAGEIGCRDKLLT